MKGDSIEEKEFRKSVMVWTVSSVVGFMSPPAFVISNHAEDVKREFLYNCC